ncbi:MAG: hypothetical protein A2527_07725 [Candidatus Lambdaproteobacteria bacterium RIFOXYD2_FULL_50_16]|uniref:Sporulation protein YtfJ n=1 Tax=Candidatus Lambdaproteobacteria bacterium RIFOXYD2_FULL_50_16 TaxID=1817772 RepID=A0A1F6GBA8_9PROT|nr:MAG: hypothetical protein A2527_07725 [Candidatus Lambdaproteobacteria bacterium RIFOXYD2_FULL_50_16]
MEPKDGIFGDFLPQLKNLIKSETVFGEPYEIGGISIIPVNSVKLGFGFGGGSEDKKDGQGGGGGVVLSPVAFLVVKDGEVSIHNLSAGSVENIMLKVPEMLEKVAGLFERAGKKKTSETP